MKDGFTHKAFYELPIWKLGFQLQKNIAELVDTFPQYERFALADQLRRSSNSVIANIAQAHGRYHFKDKIRVLYISRGEILETQSHILVAVSRTYIQTKDAMVYVNEYESLKKQLNAYVNTLSKK